MGMLLEIFEGLPRQHQEESLTKLLDTDAAVCRVAAMQPPCSRRAAAGQPPRVTATVTTTRRRRDDRLTAAWPQVGLISSLLPCYPATLLPCYPAAGGPHLLPGRHGRGERAARPSRARPDRRAAGGAARLPLPGPPCYPAALLPYCPAALLPCCPPTLQQAELLASLFHVRPTTPHHATPSERRATAARPPRDRRVTDPYTPHPPVARAVQAAGRPLCVHAGGDGRRLRFPGGERRVSRRHGQRRVPLYRRRRLPRLRVSAAARRARRSHSVRARERR